MKTALLILVFNSMVFAQGPSLGDVARQERARQKSNTGNINKVTNETLGTAAALPPEPEPVKSDAEPGKTPEGKEGKDGKPEAKADAKPEVLNDEASWRAAFTAARDEVKRAEARAQVVQLELNKLNMDLLTRSDIFNREGQINPLIDAKNKELASAEKALSDAREKVTRLEDDLRRAGAPIGWSR